MSGMRYTSQAMSRAHPPGVRWAVLLLPVVSLAVALALAEAAMRWLDRPQTVVVGWKDWPPSKVVNELGFKGRPASGPADATLLLLGDSQVASQTEVADMLEVYLERALRQRTGKNIRVISIATGGWGTDQELLALEQLFTAIEPRPRLVALWFTPRNDLWNNLFPTHFPRNGAPKPTFWLDRGTLQGPNAAWLHPYPDRSLYLLRAWDLFRGRYFPPLDEAWEVRLPPAYSLSRTAPPDLPSLRGYMAAQRGVTEDKVPYWWGENFANDKNHYSIFLTPPSPRMRYAAALTRALLERMAAFCNAHGAELYVFYRDERTLFPREPTDFAVDGHVVTLDLQTADVLLGELFAGLPLDVISGLTPDMLLPREDHLNARGNAYVAERLAELLPARFPGRL
jgi:hypothetical protein